MNPKKIKILIADDHEVVRHGVRDLVSAQPGWETCGEAASGRDAIRLIEASQPHVAILDLSMPGLNGMDAARQIRKSFPEVKILIFTMHETEDLVREVFRSGADGYVLKSDAGTHLVSAINAVLAGRHFCSSKLSEWIFHGFLRAANGEPLDPHAEEALTPREREIVQLLAEGQSNKEVASVLGISVKTAETHRAVIMRKLR
ncbi:MAG: response regulator transcription factor, partial [Terrimicrobiaceae bacterium]|nr:response regulator transcription factor [Terrimicrobiaceae bacterium]